MTSDLELYTIEQLIQELHRRNISFLIGYVDHTQFHKEQNGEIVWGMDRGGNTALQSTLLRFLTKYIGRVELQDTTSDADE